MKSDFYLVTLNCRTNGKGKRHTLGFTVSPPWLDDEVYCHLCREMARVVIAPHEGRVVCQGSDAQPCGYHARRMWGVGVAKSRARHHAESYPSHTLRLYLGAQHVETVDALTWENGRIRQTA